MSRKYFRNFNIYIIGFFIIWFSLAGCRNKSSDQADILKGNTIHVSVDESFKPVIEEQIRVFEKSFPDIKIIADYKTEADCFKDLFGDTTNRMIIVTRGLTDEEDRYFNDTLYYYLPWNAIAFDAITIIVNSKSNDTLFSMERLSDQLSGKSNRNQQMIFDGLNATSTVRFALDSILKGRYFDTSVVKAVKNSQEVINFVAENEDAVGFVGISWIGNPEDSAQVNMLKKVKIAYVSCNTCTDTPYVKPTQESILTRRYPLVRGLYYILKEGHNGPGTRFVNFMKNERGQLIFKRAYLGTIMVFSVRNVRLTEKL